MPAHRFNPLSALLGIAVFLFDETDNEPVMWGAAIAVFVALILVAIPTRLKPPSEDA
jgi:hypothetical protein